MREISFDEEQFPDLQALGAALFEEDSSDPRSWNYVRKLVRPPIRWGKLLFFAALLLAGAAGLYALLITISVPEMAAFWSSMGGLAVVLLLFSKRILICMIRIYQRYAPASVRNKCRFEPSCSQYMILSLQKYGFWTGLAKGINRLKRCNTNDGGFDDP